MFSFLFQGQTYAVVMVDPDAPNHNAGEAWLHWILSNVEVFFLFYREGRKGEIIETPKRNDFVVKWANE